MSITEKRDEKFRRVASMRQVDLTVVLENVHDPHNIGAVMRTCDSVGIGEIYVVNTDERLQDKRMFFGKASASGTRKWITVHYFENLAQCMNEVKNKFSQVFATRLSADAISLYEIDFQSSTALVFGNEHDGISDEMAQLCTGNFIIPQYGMVESLNISVACAVSLYEALRQRNAAGLYREDSELTEDAQKIYKDFIRRDGRDWSE